MTEPKRTQQTPEGYTFPVPTRGEFMDALRKVAKANRHDTAKEDHDRADGGSD